MIQKGKAVNISTHIMLLCAVLFWSLNPTLMKIGLNELPPFPYNALRLFFGATITGLILLSKRQFKPVPLKDAYRLFSVPLLGFLFFQFLYSFGVAATSASISAIMLGILPITVALISFLMRIERLGFMKIIGITAAVAGVVLIVAGGQSDLGFKGTYIKGIFLLVGAEIAYGLYTVLLKPLTVKYSTLQIVFFLMCFSFLFFAPYSLYHYGIGIYSEVSLQAVGSAFFSALLAMVTANILWSTGIKRLGSLNTSVYGNLQPVFGILAGFLILHESLGLMQLGGAAVILTGIYLVNRRKS